MADLEEYFPVELTQEINIKQLVTVHFFQFEKGYAFSGERHDFWEFVYVDKGSINVGADGQRIFLKENDIIFHKPGEFHSVWADTESSPDVIFISFVCNSPSMKYLENQCMQVSEDQKFLIAQIILEMRNAFSNNLNAGYPGLKRMSEGVYGAEQIVKATLEILLVKFVRDLRNAPTEMFRNRGEYIRFSEYNHRKEYLEHIVLGIETYITNHLNEKLTIDSICSNFNICRSSVNRLFRYRYSMSFNEYLTTKRHECAKRLLREGNCNMFEIAEICGFCSPSYFSRKFVSIEKMTPSEYSRSVRRYAPIDSSKKHGRKQR